MSKLRVLVPLVVVVVALGASIAHAQTLPASRTFVNNYAESQGFFFGACNQNAESNPWTISFGPQTLSNSVSSTCIGATAAAAAQVRAGNGQVGVHFSASAAGSLACINNGGVCNQDAEAQAGGQAELDDYFLVQSSTLAAQTPVTLYFTAMLHYTLANAPPGTATAGVSMFASGPGGTVYLNSSAGGPQLQSASYQFQTRVGDMFSAVLYMGGSVDIYSGPTQSGSVDLDASHTGSMYFDAITPDVTLLSSSGFDYSSPQVAVAPEPASLSLVASGLAGIAGVIRRRKIRSWEQRT